MRRQRAMSSEKRAESCFKVPQSSLLKAQSSLLKAQSRNEKIRVNPCDTWKRKEIILSVYEVFIPLSLESETKLKKEETKNRKIVI